MLDKLINSKTNNKYMGNTKYFIKISNGINNIKLYFEKMEVIK